MVELIRDNADTSALLKFGHSPLNRYRDIKKTKVFSNSKNCQIIAILQIIKIKNPL
jgi:hypothetical protein